MNELCFGDLVFDESLIFARRGAEDVRFTRQERAVLEVLIRNPRKLMTRAQILDAISHSGSEMSDRNVDYIINRLRGKLKENAREARFIATQYGEGYVWIAERNDPLADTLLVVGPVFGLGHVPTLSSATPVLAALETALQASAEGQPIAVIQNWRRGTDANTRFSLDISFHDDGMLHAACVLRDGASGHILTTFRETLDADTAPDFAARIRQHVWNQLAAPSELHPKAAPLELRMHNAAVLLSGSPESWREIETQVQAARADAPDDPGIAIMHAMGLYARLIQNMPPLPEAEWTAAEDEIENLALQSIPNLGECPALKLGAAKLLLFIDRGHLDLAERLTQEAFEQSTAFAACFAMRGQTSMCRGDIAAAAAFYDQAIELSQEDADFLVYLLTLKATALLAANERAALDEVCAHLYRQKPLTRMHFGLVLAAPDDTSPDLAGLLSMFDEKRAQLACAFFYRTSARHFVELHHRANVMRGLLSRLVPAFGEDIVPAPLRDFDFTRN